MRYLLVLVTVFQISLGQANAPDTLGTSASEMEELLEDITSGSDESQEADRLEELTEELRNTIHRANVRVRTRVQADKPVSDSRSSYLGPSFKLYQRVLMEVRESEGDGYSIAGGLVTEKDAGERFTDSFTAGYLQLDLLAFGANLLLGDFVVESGRGLMLWRSSGIRKGGDIVGPGKSKESSIRPYRSTEENHFFRGAAGRKDLGPVSIVGFISRKWLNGSTNADGIVTSLDSDGLFRTESEASTLRAMREVTIGGAISIRPIEGILASLKGLRSSFDRAIDLSRQKDFSGKDAGIVAADLIVRTGTVSISGEAARDKKGSVAGSLGLYLAPSPVLSAVVAARAYPASFNSLHGFPLSEVGPPEGEEGLYIGANIRLSGDIKISFFYDLYVLSNRFPFRSEGEEFFARWRMKIRKKWEVAIEYKRQNKPGTFDSEEKEVHHARAGRAIQDRYRVSLYAAAVGALRWQTRIEATVRKVERRGREYGYHAFQEIRWQALPSLRVSFRLTVFETKSYETRMFAFEPDVPGGLSNLPLWGSGSRAYLLFEYAASEEIRLCGKVSRLFRDISFPEHEVRERFTLQCDLSF